MEDPTLTIEERHQLLSVLRELDGQAPAEQRRHPRRGVHLRLTLRVLGEPRVQPMPALLVNVAARGVGLQVDKPLDAGRRFLLPLRFLEGGGRLVLCEVRSCTPCGAAFKVGARFLEHIDDPSGTAKPPMDWLV
jgi:hypothetical protein